MEQNIFKLNDKIYSNNNDILQEILTSLNQLLDYSKDDLITKTLNNIKDKINYIINENKKNILLIKNDILSLYNRVNKKYEEIKLNNNITQNKELYYKEGRYIGQFKNGLKEGKGKMYWDTGDRYEGEWKNDKQEGKGIFYWISGNIYEGEFKNGIMEGKGIKYWHSGHRKGDKYEGDL